MTVLTTDMSLSLGTFSLKVSGNLELDGITALFGPSGAGKTTFLRIVAGLESRATGRVGLGQETWQDTDRNLFVPPHKRRIGYVFQDVRLFPHLCVQDNLLFAGKRARRGAHRLETGEVIEAMDLRPLLQRRPASLSGGEQQRVAMGRALLNDPRLLLMDEPLSALDAARKSEIIPYIERLTERFAIPVLYVTHDVEEVTRLASAMVLVANGRIAATGGVGEVLERVDLWPLTGRLEAGAVLEAIVEETSRGMTTLNVQGETLRIPSIGAAHGTMVRLRVQAREVAVATKRPEHLSIRNALSARVLRIDMDETVFAELLLDVAGQHLRSRITREAAAELKLAAGQQVFALIKSVAFEGRLLS